MWNALAKRGVEPSIPVKFSIALVGVDQSVSEALIEEIKALAQVRYVKLLKF